MRVQLLLACVGAQLAAAASGPEIDAALAYLDGALVRLAPPPGHHGQNMSACTSDLHTKLCPDLRGRQGCSVCLLEHAPEIKLLKCTKQEQQSYCYPEWRPLSQDCLLALGDDFNPQTHEQNVAQGIGSWSMHINDPGFYYQCNNLDGFHYWSYYLRMLSKPPPDDDGPHRRSLRGGGGGKGPPHHGGGGGGGGPGGMFNYMERKVALCLPDECSNYQDAESMGNDYVHQALFHTWLEVEFAGMPRASPLTKPAYAVLAVIAVLAVLCLLGTLLATTAFRDCKAAMPLPEDVEARASEMLRAGSLSSSRFAEVEELSTYDKWRFVQACERAQDDKQPPFAGASVQGAAEGMPLSMAAEEPAAGAAAESLSQPLLPPSESDAPAQRSLLDQVVLCWDLGKNFSKGLMKKDGGAPEMRVLNGIRVLSMGWIVLSHTYQNMQSMEVKNEDYTLNVARRFISSLLLEGQLAVDTFFFLSGYLGAYVTLRKLKALDAAGKTPSTIGVSVTFFVERYLRLTPAYLFVLMFYMYVNPHLVTGPHSLHEMHRHGGGDHGGGDHGGGGRRLQGYDEDFCSQYVWTNLLYISNLYPDQLGKDAYGNLGCMDHSWYLSVDFQLHLLTPWLLMMFRYSAKAAYVAMLAMIAGSFYYVGYLVYEYDGGICGEFFHTARGNQMTLYYDKPWCRCGPFLVGIALACYQSTNSSRSGHLKAPGIGAILLGYFLSFVTMFVLIFSTYWAYPTDPMSQQCAWPKAWDAFYSVTRTTIWGACLAWLVYAALCCQGGPVSRFLAWSFWTPFARLTYAWYLMHPLWMDIIFQSAPAGLVYYDLLGASFCELDRGCLLPPVRQSARTHTPALSRHHERDHRADVCRVRFLLGGGAVPEPQDAAFPEADPRDSHLLRASPASAAGLSEWTRLCCPDNIYSTMIH